MYIMGSKQDLRFKELVMRLYNPFAYKYSGRMIVK